MTYVGNFPKKRIAVGVLIFRGNKLLIVEPSYQKEWQVPGGVVDADESPLAAALRECREEIDCDVTHLRLRCIDYRSKSETLGDSVQFIFEGDIGDQAPKPDGDEIKSIAWVSKEEAFEKLFPPLSARVRAALSATGVVYCENGAPVSLLG